MRISLDGLSSYTNNLARTVKNELDRTTDPVRKEEGGDFWEKLKQLFVWSGEQTQKASA